MEYTQYSDHALRQIVVLDNGVIFVQYLGYLDAHSAASRNERWVITRGKGRIAVRVGDQWHCTYGKKVSASYKSIADEETLLAIEPIIKEEK